MIHFYQAFNFKILSENLLLPELYTLKNREKHDIIIKEDKIHFEDQSNSNQYNTPFLNFLPNKLILKVNNICTFSIEEGNSIFWEKHDESIQGSDIRTFLLGSAIGALLIQRGFTMFHGNALEKNGKAVVCLGHSGAGKSTIAYSLMQQGWNLISDDLVAINDEGQILPGIPRIKLWKDAVLDFELDVNNLKPVRNNLNKYVINGEQIVSVKKQFPLHAFYLIERNENINSFSEIEPEIIKSEKISFLKLKNQLYRPRFVKGLGKEKDLFSKIVNLQKKVPLIKLPILYGIDKMNEWFRKNDLSDFNILIN